jgi:hypothetical protein
VIGVTAQTRFLQLKLSGVHLDGKTMIELETRFCKSLTKAAFPMTNPERSVQTQQRIDEIEKMLEELRPRCDKQLAGYPRPGATTVQMCRMEQLERELERLRGF